VAILGKMSDGYIIKVIISKSEFLFLQTILGPQALSILPLVMSLLVLVIVSRFTYNK